MGRVVVQGKVILVVGGGEGPHAEAGIDQIQLTVHQKVGLVTVLAPFEHHPAGWQIQRFQLALDGVQVSVAEPVERNKLGEPGRIRRGDGHTFPLNKRTASKEARHPYRAAIIMVVMRLSVPKRRVWADDSGYSKRFPAVLPGGPRFCDKSPARGRGGTPNQSPAVATKSL